MTRPTTDSAAATTGSRAEAPHGSPPTGPGLPKRFIQLFVAPGKLFARLRDRPEWFGALFVGIVMTATANALLPVELWEQGIREAVLESGRGGTSSVDVAAIAKWATTGGVLVGWPIVVAGIGAGVWALFGALLGDEGTFRQYFAATAHAALILAVGSLVILPLKVAEGDLGVSLHIGLFLPFVDGFGAALLRAFDLFNLWFVALLAVGASRIDGRRRATSAFLILVCIQAMLVVPMALLVTG